MSSPKQHLLHAVVLVKAVDTTYIRLLASNIVPAHVLCMPCFLPERARQLVLNPCV